MWQLLLAFPEDPPGGELEAWFPSEGAAKTRPPIQKIVLGKPDKDTGLMAVSVVVGAPLAMYRVDVDDVSNETLREQLAAALEDDFQVRQGRAQDV